MVILGNLKSVKKEEKGCGGRVSKIRIRNGEESNDLMQGQDVKKMFSCLYNLVRGRAMSHSSKYHIILNYIILYLCHIILYHIISSFTVYKNSFFLSFFHVSLLLFSLPHLTLECTNACRIFFLLICSSKTLPSTEPY